MQFEFGKLYEKFPHERFKLGVMLMKTDPPAWWSHSPFSYSGVESLPVTVLYGVVVVEVLLLVLLHCGGGG